MNQADARAANTARLKEVIQQESESLKRAVELYVARAGLTAGQRQAESIAGEILGELTVEALQHADRFDPSRQAYAWLLGIAANLIRRRQVEQAKLARREPLARGESGDPDMSEDELFDRLFPPHAHDPGEAMEQDQQVEALLARVSAEDRWVIRLAILDDLDGEALARELMVRPGAARVRLHRALLRLRAALESQERPQ